ncbi:phosphoribosylanthranilate isomerase [Marinilongibacter aquaticus]|uniref:phosphoribosylanthranilate isomerase n=1 Tax=Marinilongibacter aquaticus TaxID=2975157 RepID=UPI0021BD56EB|nr:phosphoribosylanthranilate isomerase [Marinilongibacter aquaticus]UBM60692.1 phosphoribosylanthranilate isomerase [Marinilongibacter aquaticus]
MKTALTWKVCGMREPQNISEVLRLEPDFLGFIFFEKSPRFVGQGFDLNEFDWNEHTQKVGVFVNQEEEVLSIARRQHLDFVQLHGAESPAFCKAVKEAGYGVLKAFSVDEDFDFALCDPYQEVCDFFLFDTKLPGAYGGHGQRFDWGLLEKYKGDRPFWLAGGIAPNTLKEVGNLKHPKFAGIDVNSKFEISPALKHITLLEEVKAFLSMTRSE